MDILTIGFLGAIFVGLMAGDAVISSNTMTVNVGLPPVVQQSGLTRGPAEELFVTELARITSIPSALPLPMPRVASRRTVVGAIAQPLMLTEMTSALQDLFGLQPIRIGLLPVRWTPSLVCLGQRLEIHRAEIADGRVSSPRVVEALDVVEHVGAGLVAGAVDAAAYPLGFQR